jgi:hypothetical protein
MRLSEWVYGVLERRKVDPGMLHAPPGSPSGTLLPENNDYAMNT